MNFNKIVLMLFLMLPCALHGSKKSARVAPAVDVPPTPAAHDAHPAVSPRRSSGTLSQSMPRSKVDGTTAAAPLSPAADKPPSPLTVAGHVADVSLAKGQSTHDANFKQRIEKSDGNNNGGHGDALPIPQSPFALASPRKITTMWQERDLNAYIANLTIKKKIGECIKSSLAHGKTVAKAAQAKKIDQDQITKNAFADAFRLLILNNHQKEIEDETLNIPGNVITAVATIIWSKKDEYYTPECCEDCCIIA